MNYISYKNTVILNLSIDLLQNNKNEAGQSVDVLSTIWCTSKFDNIPRFNRITLINGLLVERCITIQRIMDHVNFTTQLPVFWFKFVSKLLYMHDCIHPFRFASSLPIGTIFTTHIIIIDHSFEHSLFRYPI